MHMTISGHHLTVTEPMRDYVTAKLSKLELHDEQITPVSYTHLTLPTIYSV